ncbi:hypothetical protein QZH41_020347 [Actinostola sp. cb2023]|nr:hypothetical protein QZH41_020347 [Actinostola sp. cb2023]
MSWTASQNRRLGQEEQLLNDYFPNNVKWINRMDTDMKVEVKMTTNSNKSYTLRVCIPPDYPNSCPELLVSNPSSPLKDVQGNELQCGTDNHSYGTKYGLTTICHFVPSVWTNEYTLYQVFMKGRIWLEAYEVYLRTEKPMKTYLREMQSNLPIEPGPYTAVQGQGGATKTFGQSEFGSHIPGTVRANLDEAFALVVNKFKISSLNFHQKTAIEEITKYKKDMFVNLPTGFGKSLIYQALPIVVDHLRGSSGHIVAVVSPLISLMDDQVQFLKRIDVTAVNLSSLSEEDKVGVENGAFSVVFGSPEAWLKNERWRAMLNNQVFSSKLCAIAIDECHVIRQW